MREELKKATEAIGYLLDRREMELENDISSGMKLGDCQDMDLEPAYRDGYIAGYRDLLSDLRNLIVHCGYLEETCEEENKE